MTALAYQSPPPFLAPFGPPCADIGEAAALREAEPPAINAPGQLWTYKKYPVLLPGPRRPPLSWYRRHAAAVAVWGRKTPADIVKRMYRHTERCEQGCRIDRSDGPGTLVFELSCWTGAVLYDALYAAIPKEPTCG